VDTFEVAPAEQYECRHHGDHDQAQQYRGEDDGAVEEVFD